MKRLMALFLALALCAGIIGATPLLHRVWEKYRDHKAMAVVQPVLIVLALISVTAVLVDGSFNPFLYFRF